MRPVDRLVAPSLAMLLLGCATPAESAGPVMRVPEAQASPASAFNVAKTLRELSDPKRCAERVGHSGTFESCEAKDVRGRGVLLQLVTECGGDSCSSQAWLLIGEGAPLPLSGFEGGGLAIAPDLDFYVTDRQRFDSFEDMVANQTRRAPALQRFALAAKHGTAFAPCMSPQLTPDERWFMCRNRYDDVLRVAVSGGPLQLVTPNPHPGPVPWSPHAFLYPASVDFDAPNRMRVLWAGAGQEEVRAYSAAPAALPLAESLPTGGLPAEIVRALGDPDPAGAWRHLSEVHQKGISLSAREVLVVAGPALRVLFDGALVYAEDPAPIAARGPCCDAGSGTSGGAAECELPAVLAEAWLELESRRLVTLRRAFADRVEECQSEPHIEQFELPRKTTRLRDFEPKH